MMEIIKELFWIEFRKAQLGMELLLRFWWVYALMLVAIYLYVIKKSR